MLRPTTGDRLNMNSFECWVIVLLTSSVLLEKHSFMHYCLIISNKLKIYYSSLLLLPGKVSGHLKEQLQAHLHTCHHCSSLLTSKVFSKCYFQGIFYCYSCEKRIVQNVTNLQHCHSVCQIHKQSRKQKLQGEFPLLGENSGPSNGT